jgi:hypothetical protein
MKKQLMTKPISNKAAPTIAITLLFAIIAISTLISTTLITTTLIAAPLIANPNKTAASGGQKTVQHLLQSIPKQIGQWKTADQDQFFNKDTIFKHINGGAELYLAYDYHQTAARKYTGPGDAEIALDIYDMGNSLEAYGIFTAEREDKEAGYGQGSEYSDGLLRFWKDRFFISILAVGDSIQADPTIRELAKAVENAITDSGPQPQLLNYLPTKNLDKSRIRYFHHVLLLDKHYYIASENILHLNDDTDCVLAEYLPEPNDPELTFLLIVQYKSPDLAKSAQLSFLKTYMPEAETTGITKMENNRWATARLIGHHLAIVFDAPNKNKAVQLQDSINWRQIK